MVAVNKSLNQPSFSYKMWLKIGDGWFLLSFPTLTSAHARHMMVLLSWFRAWRLHCESRNQGKGMLEVPWLAVEPREWFASTRSTFQCRESWFNLRNFQSLPVVLLDIPRNTSRTTGKFLFPFPLPFSRARAGRGLEDGPEDKAVSKEETSLVFSRRSFLVPQVNLFLGAPGCLSVKSFLSGTSRIHSLSFRARAKKRDEKKRKLFQVSNP